MIEKLSPSCHGSVASAAPPDSEKQYGNGHSMAGGSSRVFLRQMLEIVGSDFALRPILETRNGRPVWPLQTTADAADGRTRDADRSSDCVVIGLDAGHVFGQVHDPNVRTTYIARQVGMYGSRSVRSKTPCA